MSSFSPVLPSLPQAPGLTIKMLEAQIETMLKIFDLACVPFRPMMSLLLPHWVTNDQFIQRAAEIMKVWMCLRAVFLY